MRSFAQPHNFAAFSPIFCPNFPFLLLLKLQLVRGIYLQTHLAFYYVVNVRFMQFIMGKCSKIYSLKVSQFTTKF